MPFVPALDTVEVFLEHNFAGAPGKGYVIHFREAAGPWTTAKMVALHTSLVNWWNVNIKPLVQPLVVLERIRMRDLTTVNGLVYDSTAGLPLGGTRAGVATANNVVISVKKNTGLAGKSFRGRVYHFGLVGGDISGNQFTFAYANLLEAAWNASITMTSGALIFDQCLVSKFSLGQPRAAAVVTPILSYQLVDRRVDTNRLKLPKSA